MKSLWAAFILLMLTDLAVATDNHIYKIDDYITISGGESPDKHWSIAAYGKGSDGSEDFHLYLMREPTHQKMDMLVTGEHLDTGPFSIIAYWSPDSNCVAILYRSDRHVLDLKLYSIDHDQSQTIAIPSLVNIIGSSYLKSGIDYELFGRYFCIAWKNSNQIVVEEFNTFDAKESIFRPGLEAYLNLDQLGTERIFTNFAARAIYDITERNNPHFLNIEPLSFKSTKIVYSSHLRFDPKNGLYNTKSASDK